MEKSRRINISLNILFYSVTWANLIPNPKITGIVKAIPPQTFLLSTGEPLDLLRNLLTGRVIIVKALGWLDIWCIYCIFVKYIFSSCWLFCWCHFISFMLSFTAIHFSPEYRNKVKERKWWTLGGNPRLDWTWRDTLNTKYTGLFRIRIAPSVLSFLLIKL